MNMPEKDSAPTQHSKDSGHPPAAEGEAPMQPHAKAGKAGGQPALTPEEQMALYEKDLKENDWGHQPC
jgi:hypothetical protein